MNAVPGRLGALAMRRAKAMKADIVRRQGVGTDLCPQLDLLVGGQPWMTVFMNGDGVDHAPVIAAAVAHSPCDLAVLVIEAYRLTAAESQSAHDNLGRGELGQRFASGDPAVDEILGVSAHPRTGPPSAWTVPYTYDGRTVVWGEAIRAEEVEGRVPHAFHVGYSERIAQPWDFASLSAGLLELPTVEAVGCFVEVEPPRNAPCPCGSGRKAKHCDHGAN